MNWDAIGAVGQILGALAVVLTLGYLAVQTRLARSTAADNSRLTRAVGVREALLGTVHDERFVETLTTAYRAQDYYDDLAARFGLSRTEAAQVDFYNLHWFWLHWGQYSSEKSRADLHELSRHIKLFYSIPVVAHSWSKSPFGRSLLDQRFVQFVDRLLIDTHR